MILNITHTCTHYMYMYTLHVHMTRMHGHILVRHNQIYIHLVAIVTIVYLYHQVHELITYLTNMF